MRKKTVYKKRFKENDSKIMEEIETLTEKIFIQKGHISLDAFYTILEPMIAGIKNYIEREFYEYDPKEQREIYKEIYIKLLKVIKAVK